MEHLSVHHRCSENSSEKIGAVEYVLAKKPLQGGGGLFESRVRTDGRVPREVEDCFRGKVKISPELRFSFALREYRADVVFLRLPIVRRRIQAIWKC